MSEVKLVGNNPFLNNLKIEVTEISDGKRFVNDDGVMLPEITKVEYKTHLHVFTRDKNYRSTIDKLTVAGKSLYLYIQSRLEPSDDFIEINKDNYLKTNNVKSIITYRKAVNDLIDNNIIIKMGTYQNVFWVNPHFLFCGSRINKFPKNLIVKSEVNKL